MSKKDSVRDKTRQMIKVQMSNDLGQASIPAVQQYLQLAQAQQLAVDAILAKLSLDNTLLADNSKHISGLKFQTLIHELVKLSPDPLFGLHTAQYVQPGSYSVLGYIVMNCATLGEAITKITPFEKLVGDMGVTQITRQDAHLAISWHCQFTDLLVRRHMVDNCLASWLTFARYLTNGSGSPVQVLLTRKEPTLKQVQEYQRVFNCPIRFSQKSNTIVFHQDLLALPLNKGDKNVRLTLEQHAMTLLKNLSIKGDTVDQCRQLITQQLTQGLTVQHISQDTIAAQLSISSKTLQRRLKLKRTHFKALLNGVRFEQAKILLLEHRLTLNEISQRLGFSESRSFYRWFKQLTGKTPREFTKEAK
jgi:AraC-like DNA-binding protein